MEVPEFAHKRKHDIILSLADAHGFARPKTNIYIPNTNPGGRAPAHVKHTSPIEVFLI